jgi:hypothetical protein
VAAVESDAEYTQENPQTETVAKPLAMLDANPFALIARRHPPAKEQDKADDELEVRARVLVNV